MKEYIETGSAEAEARDRLAEIGFAEVERRLRACKGKIRTFPNGPCRGCLIGGDAIHTCELI